MVVVSTVCITQLGDKKSVTWQNYFGDVYFQVPHLAERNSGNLLDIELVFILVEFWQDF
ncbi:hypothetical protein C2S51_028715 [Perilla frutescens var. frutescens]|nr:hypothetical protein C2S51_028715 [Perilla frutescens var. frutescens]